MPNTAQAGIEVREQIMIYMEGHIDECGYPPQRASSQTRSTEARR